ncbi:Hypothetical protein DHA2_17227 [Giardia duodenalis]|uniref:DinF protein n=1 Tax=Giardia intestinalis TaxID=5741 RepID=V6TF19_GIAIN|nr:Hypothetical protein DHA2_17227 [Giardia intestinalis]
MADDYDSSDDASSDFSSSVASSMVDGKIFQLSTQPVHSLLWRHAGASIVSSLLAVVAKMVIYVQVFHYSGYRSTSLFATYQPIISLLCQHPILALAKASAGFAGRALGQMQIQIANVYYSHYFFMAAIWALLVPLLFTSWYQSLACFVTMSATSAISFSTPYFALMTGMSTLFNVVTIGISPFVRLENRTFVDTVRSGLLSVLSVLFCSISYYIAYMYGATANEGGLIAAGTGNIIAHLFVSIWLTMLVFRKTVLQVALKGGLKFSTKRLFPLNGRILLKVFLIGILHWFLESIDDVLVALVNILYGIKYTDRTSMHARRIAFYNYLLMREAANVINNGLLSGFAITTNYNLVLRKYSRMYKAMLFAFMFMTIASTLVCVILGPLAEPLLLAVQPLIRKPTDDVILLQKYLKQTGKLAFITPPLMPAYCIMTVLAQLEGRSLLSILLPLPRTVTTIVILIITASVNGDQGDYLFPFPIGDAISAIIGICMFAYSVCRYKILSRMSDPNVAQIEDSRKTAATGKSLSEAKPMEHMLGSGSSLGESGTVGSGSTSGNSTPRGRGWESSSNPE